MKIVTIGDYRKALWRIEELFDCNDPDSPEGKELSELVQAVSEYEEKQELWSQ